MPAAAPVSLREVEWELARTATTAGLLVLMERVAYWLRAVARAADLKVSHELLQVPAPASDNANAEDEEKLEWHAFPCEASTIDDAARKQFVRLMSAKRAQYPDAWTAEVTTKFRELLMALDEVAAAAIAANIDAEGTSGLKVPNMDVDESQLSFDACDKMFAESYKRFYAKSRDEVLAAVNQALTDLKTSKENRPLTIKGNGAEHILHVVNLRAGPDLLLQAVRLLAEAALHDSTEATFFEKGAVEAAMRIGRETKDLEIRCHAARLFFNLAYLKSNRLAFMRKGGLHHIAYLARTTVGDTKSGNGQKLILFAAKTMYQLSCADECAKRLFFFSGFKDLWLTFARHPTQDIRQRAAGVFNKVVEQKIGSRTIHSGWCRFLVEELLHGVMASDSNNNAMQAQKKARNIASSQGWRARADS